MRLGRHNLSQKPVFMAPMAGITDKAFRHMIRLTGGKYVITEMISDKALIYNNSKTFKMIDLEGEPEPRIVQLFGSEPHTMADAAKIVFEHGADAIDINMGCPTPKIVKNGEGAALLRDITLAEKIASTVVKSVPIPVTVKIRLGWDDSCINAPELALRLEQAGIAMLTVHARTREQYYSGNADWQWIARTKAGIKIPVIGNGDINSPEDAMEMIKTTECDGVMIGRGALGNPWLIGRTQTFLDNGILLPEPDNIERLRMLFIHFEQLIDLKGERTGLQEIRKHAAWYIKGVRKAADYRNQIMTVKTYADMKALFLHIYSLEGGTFDTLPNQS
ncbi:tRNA dihydrouridine synthase DusB [Dehalobacter sp. DCM]|uniref:tRNA dihydrouridine synthase DusB n=1 Tax=Dehalobacter sp. DCM TaxID=2907827 RepID=UPI003081CA0E|nr:tRNA dihydrouridine synthase DusB [Dehalobacter sp. DCM]